MENFAEYISKMEALRNEVLPKNNSQELISIASALIINADLLDHFNLVKASNTLDNILVALSNYIPKIDIPKFEIPLDKSSFNNIGINLIKLADMLDKVGFKTLANNIDKVLLELSLL